VTLRRCSVAPVYRGISFAPAIGEPKKLIRIASSGAACPFTRNANESQLRRCRWSRRAGGARWTRRDPGAQVFRRMRARGSLMQQKSTSELASSQSPKRRISARLRRGSNDKIKVQRILHGEGRLGWQPLRPVSNIARLPGNRRGLFLRPITIDSGDARKSSNACSQIAASSSS
jgi:hypothetical protein